MAVPSFGRVGYANALKQLVPVQLRAQDVSATNGVTVEAHVTDETAHNYWGVCSTAAATAAKTVDCANFTLVEGAKITIFFTATNTAANAVLNVNGTGAAPVYYKGAAIAAGTLLANLPLTFVYRGSQWHLVGYADTTYSAMSVAEGVAGTATTSRVMRADYFKQMVQSLAGALDDSITALIPGEATASNQLADKNYVADMIETFDHEHLYYNASGANFPTNAALSSATTFYNVSGAVVTPLKNDFVIVTADASAPVPFTGGQTKWTYTTKNGTLQWVYGYALETAPLNRTVTGNDNATGTTTDTGGNLSIPIPVTIAAPSASTTQATAGTRSLRALEQILVNNIAALLSYFTSGQANSAIAATKLTNTRAINGVGFDGQTNVNNYAVCSTAAATAAKVVDKVGFVLETGASIKVKFSATNTAASPTLNVNNTGAKPVYYNNAAITAGYLKINRIYEFLYNGTQWEFVGDVDTNTTYSAMSQAEATAGTVTTARVIAANVLKAAIEALAPLDAAYCTNETDMASKNLRNNAVVLMEIQNSAVDAL